MTQSLRIRIANVAALAVLGVGVTLTAGSAGAQGTATCTGIELRSGNLIFGDGFESGDLSAWQGGLPSFQATAILDLDLAVRFAEGSAGEHVLHVKLLTPKGHHYQTLTAPIAFDPARAGASRRVEGFPRPLAVRVGRAGRGPADETEVAQQLPVAGTSIVTSGLYGEWTATAYLNDATDACGPSAGFIITP